MSPLFAALLGLAVGVPPTLAGWGIKKYIEQVQADEEGKA